MAEPDFRYRRGFAVVAHPHPLYGGTMNNKVVHTLFKAFLELGFVTVKFNFRGVEQSEGELNSGNDKGTGETEDVLAVVETIRNQFAASFDTPPLLLLAGFSFGGAVQAYAAQRLQPQIVVLVAPAVQRHALRVKSPTSAASASSSRARIARTGDQASSPGRTVRGRTVLVTMGSILGGSSRAVPLFRRCATPS